MVLQYLPKYVYTSLQANMGFTPEMNSGRYSGIHWLAVLAATLTNFRLAHRACAA